MHFFIGYFFIPVVQGTVIGFDPCTVSNNPPSIRAKRYVIKVKKPSDSGTIIDTATTYNLHDAISDLFSALNPKKFRTCFITRVHEIVLKTELEVVAIDGKTVRGAASKGNTFPLHIVSAFCTKNRLCLGQQSVSEKSNEITAIPKLLELLTLDGCIVTTDAMGCQKETAKKIRAQKADYMLQVKDNHKDLKEQMEDLFNSKTPRKTDLAVSMGHGRIEKRQCEAIAADNVLLDGSKNWKDWQTLIRIKSE